MDDQVSDSDSVSDEFKELPSELPHDAQFNWGALCCIVVAGVISCVNLVDRAWSTAAELSNMRADAGSFREPVLWFFGLSTSQIVVFLLALRALIRRNGRLAIALAVGLFVVTVLWHLFTPYVHPRERA